MRLRRKDYKYITIDEIGSIYFRKSARAKRVIISVKSSKSITVTVPRFISFKSAESFVNTKIDWIKKHQSRINNKIDISKRVEDVSTSQKERLISRVEYLAEKFGFQYSNLTIKKMKTRWGSCSSKNNISLNVGLIYLPIELQDYVILHELVHTKIKNHGELFWKKLDSIVPEAKIQNRKLNKNYNL